MRLLMVVAEMGSGGAEALVEDLSGHRLRAGDEVAVASSGGRRADALGAAGARLVPVPLHHRSPARALAASVALRRALDGWRPDVVHAHNVGACLVARLAVVARRRRSPVVATVHGLPAADYARAAAVLRRCADVVVAVSDSEATHLVRAGLPERRLRVIDNAVAPPPPHDRAAVRASLGLPLSAPVGLSVARAAAPKRPDLLLDAWAGLANGAVLLVAGDGPLLAPLRSHPAVVAGRVRLLGERADVDRLLAAADVFCLASDSEGMPMAVLEAMSAGVPVVASAVGGLAASCADAARLVPPGSVPAFREAVAALLADPAARSAYAEAGRTLVAARFSVTAMRSAYDALYAGIAAGSVR